MKTKIPWITESVASKFPISLPIDSKGILNYLQLEKNTDGFYNTLEETFWAIIGLKKLGGFPETNQKKLISYIMRHRMESGGYTSKLEGETADVWSTFYAIALLFMMGVFKERLIDEKLFCPNCGQKQLFKTENCFNCEAPLIPEKTPCIICNRVVHKSSSSELVWENVCTLCHDTFLEDLNFIISLQEKKGFMHCNYDKCIVCKGRPSYKSTFYAINALTILKSIDKLDLKNILVFLKKNQYNQEIERIFQILSYKLLNQTEDIDYLALLETIIPFQHKNSGFGIGKKAPVMSDTFWSVVSFYLVKQINLIQLGPIYNFLLGLKRADGGYSEQIMDTLSTIISTVQSYLIILMIFDPLIEIIEDAILRESSSGIKIYLAPIAEKNLISADFIESVVYHMFSKEWFSGKIIDQLDYLYEYLEQSNVITQKIAASLFKAIPNQSELKLDEFCKNSNFDFQNDEERVKTVIIDFLSKKFLEGELRKIKKHFIFQDINIPRKFLSLEKLIPAERVFEEKAQIASRQYSIEASFQRLFDFPKIIEEEILTLIEQLKIADAREKLKLGINNFKKEIEAFEGKLTEIVSQFKYVNFKETMIEFFDEWPVNKKALSLYITKFKNIMTGIIDKKEQFKDHEDLLSKEQKIIGNFEEYTKIFGNKIDLLTQNFKKFFQKNYEDHESATTKILELNQNIESFFKDLTEKFSQFTTSIEVSEIPETVNASKNLLDSKIQLLKKIVAESETIVNAREKIPHKIKEDTQNFKDNLNQTQSLIKEKIENKEFDIATKEIEKQDEDLRVFNNTTSQSLEANIKKHLESFTHFKVSFYEFRTLLNKELKLLETEWGSQRDELLTKFHQKTELTQKNQLKIKIQNFLNTETTNLESLKQAVETSIKHENIADAKSKLETAISNFTQKYNEFEMEINANIKETTKQYKTFKKLVNDVILGWEKDRDFILQSMQALLDQISNLTVEKDLLTQQNKLDLIMKNQKLLLSKEFSNLMKNYHDSLQKNLVLQNENLLSNNIKNIQTVLTKSGTQINDHIKLSSKKFPDFPNICSSQMELWQKNENIIKKALQKLEDHLTEDLMIENIYFVVKAFEGYRAELKYLAKALHVKASQLKDTLVGLLSRSRIEGTLDPINDILTLPTLNPINEVTESFLKQIEEEIGTVLQIDFVQKKAIPEEMEEKKRNLLQLRYLLVIHRDVGATLFHRKLGTWEINPDLISGFLTAIGSFGSEIKSKSVPITKMAYKEFEILLNQGELIVSALILDGNSNEWHETKLATFTKEFEQQFHDNLKIWSGELTQFKAAGLMIDRIFELFRVYM